MFAEVSSSLSVEMFQHPHFIYNWFANEAFFLHSSENATVFVRKFLYQPAYGQNFRRHVSAQTISFENIGTVYLTTGLGPLRGWTFALFEYLLKKDVRKNGGENFHVRVTERPCLKGQLVLRNTA